MGVWPTQFFMRQLVYNTTKFNLVDNYVPLVLSVYSIVFKCNGYDLYCKSLLRCWVMFMVFHRRHYDKALFIVISAFTYWQEKNHPMYHTPRQALVAFDEYPVENFHSVLRARTSATDNTNQVSLKAKEIETCKNEMHSFKSMFVPPKKFNFSRLPSSLERSLKCCSPILARLYYYLGFKVRARRWQSGHCQTCLETKLCLTEFSHWDSHQSNNLPTQKVSSIL